MEIIIIIAVFILFYELQCNVYINRCFKDLDIEFAYKDIAVFEGEKTEIIQQLSNRKWMPIWWLKIQYTLSANLKFNDNKGKKLKEYNKIDEFGLLGYEKIERRYAFVASKRGCYDIKDIEAISSDLFVTNMVIKNIENSSELFVFPRQLDNVEFQIKFDNLLGEVITKRLLIKDPFQITGIRNYNEYDNLKDINWIATAKTGEMKVNKYNYTANEKVVVLLTVARENSWVEDETIEEVIRVASTLNSEFTSKGIPVSLITDCKYKDEGVFCEAGFDNEHNFNLNKALSTIDISNNRFKLNDEINEYSLCGDKNSTLMIVSNYTGEDLKEAILNCKKNDFFTKWIVVEDKEVKSPIMEEKDIIVWEGING